MMVTNNELANQNHDTAHRLARIERRLIDIEESNLSLLAGIQQLKVLCQQIQSQLSSGMTPADVDAVNAKLKEQADALNKVAQPKK